MDRAKKVRLVTALHDILKNKSVCIVAHYKGLSVKQMTELRYNSISVGVIIKVSKNLLIKRALKNTNMEIIIDLFVGQTLMICANDVISAPKIAIEFSKNNKNLVILGGCINKSIININDIKTLANLSSIDNLHSKFIGVISTPVKKIANIFITPIIQLVCVIYAYINKR